MVSRLKAKESAQVARFRKKIEDKIKHEELALNPAAISKMRTLLENQLSERQNERVKLKDKSIAMFDENRHPESSHNKSVAKLLFKLQHPKTSNRSSHLLGRVKPLGE